MQNKYQQYYNEIINDILFKIRNSGEFGVNKSSLDLYLNQIYSNKLGRNYNEFQFDSEIYFIYKRLEEESIIHIHGAFISLTNKGCKAEKAGYDNYINQIKKGMMNLKFHQQLLYLYQSTSIVIKSILWIIALLVVVLSLLKLLPPDNLLLKGIKSLLSILLIFKYNHFDLRKDYIPLHLSSVKIVHTNYSIAIHNILIFINAIRGINGIYKDKYEWYLKKV